MSDPRTSAASPEPPHALASAASSRIRRARKIAELIESAPPLTDDQVQQLTTLLHVHPRLAAPPTQHDLRSRTVHDLEQRRARLDLEVTSAPVIQAAAR